MDFEPQVNLVIFFPCCICLNKYTFLYGKEALVFWVGYCPAKTAGSSRFLTLVQINSTPLQYDTENPDYCLLYKISRRSCQVQVKGNLFSTFREYVFFFKDLNLMLC